MRLNSLLVLLVAGLAVFAAAQDMFEGAKGSPVSQPPPKGEPQPQPQPPAKGSEEPQPQPQPPAKGSEAALIPTMGEEQNMGSQMGSGEMRDLLAVLKDQHLNRFLEALQTDQSILSILNGAGPFTIFAPSNQAWANLGQRTINSLLGDPVRLRKVLLYHIVTGRELSNTLTDGLRMTTLSGEQIVVHALQNDIRINDALITNRDIMARNGIIHTLDGVLIPPSLLGSGSSSIGSSFGSARTVLIPDLLDELSLTRFRSLLNEELLNTLRGPGPYTVFAPSEDAINRISQATLQALAADPVRLRQVVLYHVVPGLYPSNLLSNDLSLTTLQGQPLRITVNPSREVRVNDARVVSADHYADNGVVHIIDALLLPPDNTGLPTIPVLAQQLGLTTFLNNVLRADQGMYQTLSSRGPYTVFIPTNEAWANFAAEQGSAMGRNLLEDPILLRQIMFYHILFGSYPVSSLTEGPIMTLDDNQRLTLSRSNTAWKADNAFVTTADRIASNGVIHIIDHVLVPPNLRPPSSGAVMSSIGSAEALIPGSEAPVDLLGLASRLRLSRFLSLLNTSDPAISSLLTGPGPFTLFVPNDAALAQLDPSTLADPSRLRQLILFWLTPGLHPTRGLRNGAAIPTLEGERLTPAVSNNRLLINGVRALATDNAATNGIIHVLEGIIYPPSFFGSGAVIGSSIGSAVGSGLLLLPDVASQLGLDRFLELIRSAGLENILRGTGPYTIFAPSNEAIAALPADVLGSLSANNAALRQVLLYHVLPGLYSSSVLNNGMRINTLQGSPVIFTRPTGSAASLLVNNARVLNPDQLASNGIIHIIDNVVIPAPLASGVPSSIRF